MDITLQGFSLYVWDSSDVYVTILYPQASSFLSEHLILQLQSYRNSHYNKKDPIHPKKYRVFYIYLNGVVNLFATFITGDELRDHGETPLLTQTKRTH